MDEKLQKMREYFEGSGFAGGIGCRIEEVLPDYARCSLELTEYHLNSMGNVMGGVYFTLADFAAAVAANQNTLGLVTLDAHITFLGRAKGSRLIAEARCLKDGRTTDIYTVSVTDDLGNPVTVANMTMFDTTAVK